MTPTIFIPVGVPGSGKSFLGAAMVDVDIVAPGCVISPDNLRENLLGDVTCQEHNDRIFKVAYASLEAAIAAGQSVYFDATNASEWTIKTILRVADRVGEPYRVEVIKMSTSLDTSLTQNTLRDRVVPEHVIHAFVGKVAKIKWDDLDEAVEQLENIEEFKVHDDHIKILEYLGELSLSR